MVSLSTEITDTKGRRARRGWIFFDGDCPRCAGLVARWRAILEPRGFGFARLQDPRVRPLLGVAADQLLFEMKVLTAEGKQLGGADALVFLASAIWWTWPVHALARLPGVLPLLRAAYGRAAPHRRCTEASCGTGIRVS